MALELTTENFKSTIESSQLSMVDFWAEWCGPCKMIGPIIEELSTENEGKVNIGKVDVTEQSDLAAEYGVRNIPTILFSKMEKLLINM